MTAAYPYTAEQDKRSDKLMAQLLWLTKKSEEVKKELRGIIYSIEKPL